MELFPRRKEFLHSVVIWCKKELNQSAAQMKVKITISIKSFINEKLNLQKTILFDSKKLLMPVMSKRSKMNSIQVLQFNVVSGFFDQRNGNNNFILVGPNDQECLGRGLLHLAVLAPCYKIIKLLLEKGADPNCEGEKF